MSRIISLNIYPQRAGTESIWFNIVNIMVADALAPCVAKSSAAIPWENKWSPWAHGELTVVTAPGPNDHGSVTARSQLSHGEVTAQSRLGHSSVKVRSQLNHGQVTPGCEHLQYDHGSVTARSQLNHGPGHGSVTAGCDHFGHGELTVSSHGGQFLSHGMTSTMFEAKIRFRTKLHFNFNFNFKIVYLT